MEISAETLVDLLRGRAIEQPNRLAYSFLPKGETEETRLTYAELDLRARAIGVWLSSATALGEQIASECAARLRRHVPKGPYALAGWCASGIVALEVARQLEEQGEQVAFVALFDVRDGFLPSMNQFRRMVVRSWRFAQRIVFFGSEVRSLWQRAGNWNLGVRKAARRFQQLAADPTDVLDLALQHYQSKPWSGRTIHLWAVERPKGPFRDPEFIWGHLSPAGFQFHEVPGDHDSMLREPNTGKIAEILGSELFKADAETQKIPTDHRHRQDLAKRHQISSSVSAVRE